MVISSSTDCPCGAYEISFGSIAWLLLCEMFPPSVLGQAVSLVTTVNWGVNFILAVSITACVSPPVGVYVYYVWNILLDSFGICVLFGSGNKGEKFGEYIKRINEIQILQLSQVNQRNFYKIDLICFQTNCLIMFEYTRSVFCL